MGLRTYTFEGEGTVYTNFQLQSFPVHFTLHVAEGQDRWFVDQAGELIAQIIMSRHAPDTMNDDELPE